MFKMQEILSAEHFLHPLLLTLKPYSFPIVNMGLVLIPNIKIAFDTFFLNPRKLI